MMRGSAELRVLLQDEFCTHGQDEIIRRLFAEVARLWIPIQKALQVMCFIVVRNH